MSLNLLPKLSGVSDEQRNQAALRSLMQREAQIGGQLFGPVPKGRSRQFFCLDERTWIWYETWTDEKGQVRTVTTRYESRPNGVVKSQDGAGYQYVSLEEGRHLYQAVELYEERINADFEQLRRTGR